MNILDGITKYFSHNILRAQEVLQEALGDLLCIYTWRDALEIIILAAVIYAFFSWLNKDSCKRPIFSFYLYCFLVTFTHFLNLSIVNILLLLAAPIIAVLLIIAHQDSLQKNIITYKSINPNYDNNPKWLEELTRGLLSAIHKHKEILCVVERNDHLSSLIQVSFNLNAELNKDVLDLLFEHQSYRPDNILWISHTGKIKAFNGSIILPSDKLLFSCDLKDIPAWKQDALCLTSKTDAIVLRMIPDARLCDLIVQGKIIEGLRAAHGMALLKQILAQENSISQNINQHRQKDKYFHAHQNGNFSEQQLS